MCSQFCGNYVETHFFRFIVSDLDWPALPVFQGVWVFLAFETLRAKPRKVPGKPGWVGRPHCWLLRWLSKDLSTLVLPLPSDFCLRFSVQELSRNREGQCKVGECWVTFSFLNNFSRKCAITLHWNNTSVFWGVIS